MLMNPKHQILFEPIKIGNLELKNRYIMSPMRPGGLCDADGTFNQRGVNFYVERAKGGVGLIITGMTMVENEIEKCNMPSMPCPTINPLNFIATSKNLTDRIHAYGAKIFLQLSAGFGRISTPSIAGRMAVGPSPIPHHFLSDVVCRELEINEIKTYVKKFAESAAIAKKAGFDGIEVHGVHGGYLLDQFAISFFNHRTDEYGGSLRNRLSFATEIVQAIKEVCGDDYPVSLRYSLKSFIKDWNQGALPGEEFVEKGRDIDEGLEAAKILEEAGYDAFNSDVGTCDSGYWNYPPMYQKKGLYLTYNEILKKVLKVPVITAGRMEDPNLASEAIVKGQTDMIALGRPLLADAEIPKKTMQGKYDHVHLCLSCHNGCLGRLQEYGELSCAVNAACGREEEYALKKVKRGKKVMIVGAGVAGMEAARIAALSRHAVTVFEKTDKLGGKLIPGGQLNFKEDELALLNYYTSKLTDMKADTDMKIEFKFNTKVTKEIIKDFGASVVIIATGSIPKKISISDSDKVYTAEDILLGKKEPGDSTIIIGGGLVGCELALSLADKGKKVTIVELMDDILKVGEPLCNVNLDMLKDLVKFKKIDVKLNTTFVGISENGFVLKSDENEEVVSADSAIVAVGYNSDNNLYNEIKHEIPNVYVIGDANQIQNIMHAVQDAFEIARNI